MFALRIVVPHRRDRVPSGEAGSTLSRLTTPDFVPLILSIRRTDSRTGELGVGKMPKLRVGKMPTRQPARTAALREFEFDLLRSGFQIRDSEAADLPFLHCLGL
jgi:hypothetical protein